MRNNGYPVITLRIIGVVLFFLVLTSCNKDIWNRIEEIDNRLTDVEKRVNKLNSEIISLQVIISAIQDYDLITNVIALPGDEGYQLLFQSGRDIIIHNGNNGHTPQISVIQDTDGEWYWAIDDDFLLVNGQKVRANGRDGYTPQFRIDNGYWYLYNGEEWIQMGRATGDDGQDGDSLIDSIELINGYVVITLNDYDNTVLRIRLANPNEGMIESVFLVENAAVNAFINQTTISVYPNGNYSYSHVGNYCVNASVTNRLDFPAFYVIRRFSPIGIEENFSIVKDYPSNSSAFFSIDNGGDYLVENLWPRSIYSWSIYYYPDGYPNHVSTGKVYTQGQVRMLKVEGAFNVRDNGGWLSTLGDGTHRIKYGLLYRGSALDAITAIGKQTLLKEGIKVEIDLRSRSEANSRTVSAIGSSVDYYRDVLYDTQHSYGGVTVSDGFIRALKIIISSIDEQKPIYYHCASGADRGGTLAFLIEGLLGVSELDLSKDYELTAFYPTLSDRKRNNSFYAQMVKQIASINGNDILEQEDFFLYFLRGVPGSNGNYRNIDGAPSEKISSDDLKRFIVNMTDVSYESLSGLIDQ